ncbi:hypothetical protein [Vreelandella lutescens]|uniref:Uncharacterized protein n=1 Tax=Vreelandella lutescens TaxID=1602943 RepID=A0ABQ1PN75_9GAMM|nr:hypothetical protein [Halomonas lutescens]GGC99991.1 hypothetical protein GCM10011382_33150 [Halomonas lutescens]
MRFPPWLLSFVVGTALITSAGSVLAEPEADANSEQHQALDDAALEEKYGIKAGAVQRDEQPSSDMPAADASSAEEDTDTAEADTSDTDAANNSTETESTSTDTESASTNAESENTEGGTGGTGSAEDAIENGEDDQSNDDNE